MLLMNVPLPCWSFFPYISDKRKYYTYERGSISYQLLYSYDVYNVIMINMTSRRFPDILVLTPKIYPKVFMIFKLQNLTSLYANIPLPATLKCIHLWQGFTKPKLKFVSEKTVNIMHTRTRLHNKSSYLLLQKRIFQLWWCNQHIKAK
jgi:hypothetical protein